MVSTRRTCARSKLRDIAGNFAMVKLMSVSNNGSFIFESGIDRAKAHNPQALVIIIVNKADPII